MTKPHWEPSEPRPKPAVSLPRVQFLERHDIDSRFYEPPLQVPMDSADTLACAHRPVKVRRGNTSRNFRDPQRYAPQRRQSRRLPV
jgi:hypothetical protein